jgi:pyruvate dehydrogenase E2 component (dihydrolipoamide acetyltransferase)
VTVAHEVLMPALGMSQDTGKLVRWLVAEGQRVEKGDPLMEVETDKAVVELESPASGVLREVSVAEGEDVRVGTVIALIGEEGVPDQVPTLQTQELPRVAAAGDRPVEAPPAAGQPATAAGPAARPGLVQGGVPAASPKARRLAQERGLDLAALAGRGPQGAVLADDLLGLAPRAPELEAGAAPVAGVASGPVAGPLAGPVPEVTPLWRAMAENTTRSWQQVPHFFLIREVHAAGLVAARKRLAKASPEITYTDLIVRLVGEALRRHPRMNSGQDQVNVGLAVAVEAGLIVPVVHDADRLDVAQIAKRRAALVDSARAGRMRAADLQGGTFTVSNLGMYGVDLFTAIINEGQAGILALGRIADRVVAVEGKARVRPMLLLSLSCDHRAVDGARGAEFLAGLADLIEDPAGITG